MNKFKKIMLGVLSVLTLGLFAATGAKVNAKTENFYLASSDTNTSYASNDYIKTNNDSILKMKTYASGSTVSTSYLNGNYTSSLHYDANSNSTKGFRFENQSKKDLTITISMAAYDSGTSLKSHPIWFSTDGNYSNQIGTSSTSGLVTVTANLAASTDTITSYGILCCCNSGGGNARRIVIYEVSLSYTADDDTLIKFYDESNLLDEIGYSAGESIEYTPSKTNFKFDGWYTNSDLSNESALANNYTVDGSITELYAKFTPYSYLLDKSNITAIDKTNGEVNYYVDTIFNIPNGTQCQTGQTKTLPDGTGGNNTASRVSPSGGNYVTFVAPDDGIINIWVVPGSDDSTLELKNNSTTTSENTVLASKSASIAYNVSFNVNSGDSYSLGSSARMYYYKLEFIAKSVTVMQQEATKDANNNDLTIDNKPATYIRFIALVKGVTDINSSDFTFKIYREKDDVTQSITRSISTYKVLKYGGNTYSATLPTDSSAHSFDGNYGTEFYAIFVIGLTNETYSGYKVYVGISYNGGAEQTTSGYTFE